jgi:hypothetical protein
VFNNINANHSTALTNITSGTGLRSHTATFTYATFASGYTYTSFNTNLNDNKIVIYLNGLFAQADAAEHRYNFLI